MQNFLFPDELKTHVYEENANEIARNDDNIIDEAIDTAIEECKGYLTKYDLVATFDTVAPANRNKKLLSVAKDVATWHLIRLANVNMEYELRRQFYEDAIDWLQAVQAGKIDALLPMPAPVPNQIPQGNAIKWNSNAKRSSKY